MRYFLVFIIALLFYPSFVVAQETTATEEAVEITADEAIEWLRDDNLYRARGNALATQGETSVSANILSAYYNPQDSKDIQEIHADGNVVIQNRGQKAVGDKGVYNVKTGVMRVTGSNLSVTSDRATVTAQESLEYDTNARKAVAKGNAIASDDTNQIKASTITAWLANNGQGKTVLKKVTATGGIRIETPTEVILGDQGTYDAFAETATVEGNVRITRDNNQLNGDRAVVNLKTGVSQLLASPDGSQKRVRALFYPGDDATPLGNN